MKLGNLVFQKSSTTGIGNFALTEIAGYRNFLSAFPDSSESEKFYYFIRHKTLDEWEVGLGYISSGSLVRTALDVIDSSSGSNVLVNFSAGAKDVTNDLPSNIQEKVISVDQVFSGAEKTKLAGITPGAEVNTVDTVAGRGGNVVLTKSDVGLSNVDNTTDANKPISNATQTALNAKENLITTGTAGQYYRGDKTFQTLDKSAVGLGNVNNTSDINKPVSTAQQVAIDGKQALNPRVASTASSATPTPNADNTDIFILTAQAAAAEFAAPTGTPVQGQAMMIRIKDNGTARALTWNAIFRAVGVVLPTTTVLGKTLYIGMIYNLTDTKWDVIGVSQES